MLFIKMLLIFININIKLNFERIIRTRITHKC